MFDLIQKRTPAQQKSAELVLCGQVQSSGRISCEEDILIDNQHTGNILTKGLVTIGPNAVVHGSIQARVIKIFGTLKGNIRVLESITIESSANVSSGTLKSKTISIQPGAIINDVNLTTI